MMQLKFETKEQAQDFIKHYIKKGEFVPDNVINSWINHYMTCVALYRMKLADAVWFDGEIGNDGVVNATVNPNITKEALAEQVKPFIGQTRSYLIALCKGKEVPAWVICEDIHNDAAE